MDPGQPLCEHCGAEEQRVHLAGAASDTLREGVRGQNAVSKAIDLSIDLSSWPTFYISVGLSDLSFYICICLYAYLSIYLYVDLIYLPIYIYKSS